MMQKRLDGYFARGIVIDKISMTGHSMGGLVASYVAGLAMSDGWFHSNTDIEQLNITPSDARKRCGPIVPFSFSAVATPWVGIKSFVPGCVPNSITTQYLPRSAVQLFLNDKHTNETNKPAPLISILTNPKSRFGRALAMFERRAMFGNFVGDDKVPFSSSIGIPVSIDQFTPHESGSVWKIVPQGKDGKLSLMAVEPTEQRELSALADGERVPIEFPYELPPWLEEFTLSMTQKKRSIFATLWLTGWILTIGRAKSLERTKEFLSQMEQLEPKMLNQSDEDQDAIVNDGYPTQYTFICGSGSNTTHVELPRKPFDVAAQQQICQNLHAISWQMFGVHLTKQGGNFNPHKDIIQAKDKITEEGHHILATLCDFITSA